jgi:hypothetical protein
VLLLLLYTDKHSKGRRELREQRSLASTCVHFQFFSPFKLCPLPIGCGRN